MLGAIILILVLGYVGLFFTVYTGAHLGAIFGILIVISMQLNTIIQLLRNRNNG
ncbi:hypothetical protein [Brevibacillus dissolubilis]|uniref:hypothetical protein n=1 Tax=Brevibacillus dissolubilis TaxID=1844116 RepID=UPI00159BAAEF|nr:hypothetical protein [Brevibacillus dissolubilis]